jgi:hypothetical protein
VSEPFVEMLLKHRLVHDFAAALLLTSCSNVIRDYGSRSSKRLLVDQFIEHCRVAPFVEDNVADLALHLPVERIVVGPY